MRQKVLRQIKDDDFDGVIIACSCFEMIPLSDDAVPDNMHIQLKVIEQAIYEFRTGEKYDRRRQSTP